MLDFQNIEQGRRISQEGWTCQTKIKFKTKMGLAEEGGTTIGSATTGGATIRILSFKSKPEYSINELRKEESRLRTQNTEPSLEGNLVVIHVYLFHFHSFLSSKKW